MKKIIPILFVVAIFIMISHEEELIIPDYAIRFRVIANSNSLEDQNLKLKVKEELTQEFNSLMVNAKTSHEAKELLTKNMSLFQTTVDKYTKNNRISLGKNYFPEKEYFGSTIPSGDYESLVVTLGSGEGKNWWCVMFPPLCLLEAKDNGTNQVEYKFYLKELLEKYNS